MNMREQLAPKRNEGETCQSLLLKTTMTTASTAVDFCNAWLGPEPASPGQLAAA